jgi:transcriptional regulator with XRE-family HTH domain/tetratricopeptide (TPR) repeat protein
MNQRIRSPEPVSTCSPDVDADGSRMSLARLVQQARRARGWTQQEVADQLGVTALSVSRWERGLVHPHPTVAERLCALLEIPIATSLPATDTPASNGHGHAIRATPLVDPAIPTLEPLFRGRSELLQRLREQTARRHTKPGMPLCLALVGLPGVGKSAVAAAFAHQMAAQAAFDAILWGSIGPAPEVGPLLSRWARVLGVPSEEQTRLGGTSQWIPVLRTLLGGRRALVVLDDVWQVEALASLHILSTGIYLLTTRSPDLASVATSRPQDVLRVLPFSREESLALLTMLAPGAVTALPAHADALVEAVGGLPLALQVSGKFVQRAAQHGPRHIASAFAQLAEPQACYHLQTTHPFLQATSRTLYATIAQSEQALDVTARQALRRLCLLLPQQPHSFAEAAALAVLDGDAATLERLVDAGLIDYHSTERRYRIHQVIAGYAQIDADLRPDPPTHLAAQQRLVRWLVEVIRSASDLRQLDEDTETIRLGIDHARVIGGTSLIDLALAVAPSLAWQGRPAEGRDMLADALVVAREQQEPGTLVALLLQHGTLALKEGALEVAERSLREGLALLDTTDMTTTTTTTPMLPTSSGNAAYLRCLLLVRLGEVAIKGTRYAEATGWLEQGLALARCGGYLTEQADCLRHLGVLADLAGKRPVAHQAYQEGLAAARASGNTHLECQLLLNSAILFGEQGELGRAKRLLQQGVRQATRSGYRDLLCQFYDNLGYLSYRQQDSTQAWTYARKSLWWARQTGQQEWIANASINAASILIRRGAYAQADALVTEAEAILSGTGLSFLRYSVLETRGDLALAQGQLEEAEQAYETLRTLALHVGSVLSQGIAEYGLARATALATPSNLPQARAWATLSLRHLAATDHERLADVQHWLATLPSEREGERMA